MARPTASTWTSTARPKASKRVTIVDGGHVYVPGMTEEQVPPWERDLGCSRPDPDHIIKKAKDEDPERRRALQPKWTLERALRNFTSYWMQDPQVLNDEVDELFWRTYCVPYVSRFLDHPSLAPLVAERAARDGHGNAARAQMDMALEICGRVFR